MASPENNFDSHASSWDTPERIARAGSAAEGIRTAISISADFTGFEYGCGTGLLSFRLQPYLSRIVPADSSPGMLEILKAKIARAKVRNMFPIQLDLENQDPPDEKFNLIYTLMTLHHIKDTKDILSAFSAMTAPGGFLCIIDLDEEDGSFHGSGFTGHNGFNRNELSGLASESGYRDSRFTTVFTINRTIADNAEKDFPLFLMTARKI